MSGMEERLDRLVKEKKRAVLVGCSGSGKYTLVRRYVDKVKSSYDRILIRRYSNSPGLYPIKGREDRLVKELIFGLSIPDYPGFDCAPILSDWQETVFLAKQTLFQEYCQKKKVLLVILDCGFEGRIPSYLESLACTLIFTSERPIEGLKDETLSMDGGEYRRKQGEDGQDLLWEMTGGHALSMDIVSRYEKGGKSAGMILSFQKSKTGALSFSPSQILDLLWDNFEKFQEEEERSKKAVLGLLSLFSAGGVERGAFLDLCRSAGMEQKIAEKTVEKLADTGYIKAENGELSMHPVVFEWVKKKNFDPFYLQEKKLDAAVWLEKWLGDCRNAQDWLEHRAAEERMLEAWAIRRRTDWDSLCLSTEEITSVEECERYVKEYNPRFLIWDLRAGMELGRMQPAKGREVLEKVLHVLSLVIERKPREMLEVLAEFCRLEPDASAKCTIALKTAEAAERYCKRREDHIKTCLWAGQILASCGQYKQGMGMLDEASQEADMLRGSGRGIGAREELALLCLCLKFCDCLGRIERGIYYIEKMNMTLRKEKEFSRQEWTECQIQAGEFFKGQKMYFLADKYNRRVIKELEGGEFSPSPEMLYQFYRDACKVKLCLLSPLEAFKCLRLAKRYKV